MQTALSTQVVAELRRLKDELTRSLKILIQHVPEDAHSRRGLERRSTAALMLHYPVIGYGIDAESAVHNALCELVEYVDHAVDRKIPRFFARASVHQEAFEKGMVVPVRIDGLASSDLSVRASRRDGKPHFTLEVREEREAVGVP